MATTDESLVELEKLLKLGDILGIPKHISQREAVKEVKRLYNKDYSNFLKYAPAQEEIKKKEETNMITSSELGKIINMSTVSVNNLLCELGVQNKINGIWVVTNEYKSLCKEYKYSTTYSSPEIRYKWDKNKIINVLDTYNKILSSTYIEENLSK